MITSVNINDAVALESAINENGLPEFIVPGKADILLIPSSAPPCPTITIGNLQGNPIYLNQSSVQGALITGGQAPYTLVGTTGLVPDGCIVSVQEFAGNWYVVISGTPAIFNNFNFTVNIEDSNSCPGSQAFSVSVKAIFTVHVGVVVPVTEKPIPVSGLPSTYGLGVALEAVHVTNTSGGSSYGLILDNPTIEGEVYLDSEGVSGDIVDAAIFDSDTGHPDISSGISPYTGDWSSANNYLINFNGFAVNGDWIIYGVEGDLTISLIFKPI